MSKWPPILILSIVATLTFITIPRYPYLIDDALSEKAVLSYAHEHGLQYGKDIVFTYGPLGFLVSRYFFAYAAGVRMATDFATCFATALGVAFVAWTIGRDDVVRRPPPRPGEGLDEAARIGPIYRMHPTGIWRWLLFFLFVFLTANIDPRADLVLYIGLFSWGLLCFLQSGPQLLLTITMFILLGVFSVLVKANFLVLVGLSAVVIILDLVLRGSSRAAVGTAVSLIATFLLGWTAAGQSLWNLKAFFVNSIPIILGYDQTVGMEGLQVLQQRGWMTLPLIFAAVAIRALTAFSTEGAPYRMKLHCRRGFLFVWLSALIFILWKHGFVRAGLFHSGFYFGLVPIVALALEAIPTQHFKARTWARALGGLCCLICLLTMQSFFFLSLSSAAAQPFHAIPANLRALLRPAEFQRQMLQLQQAQLAETALPEIRKIVGRSSVDVFGQDQSYAIFNGLNYRPRPIFQSYMAYNTPLMRMNEQFYFSPAAPEYLLFRMAPVDRRYAPLEDAAVLQDVLINYEPIQGENQFLLLKPKRAPVAPKLTLLREGTVRTGEPILLNQSGQTDLWLHVRVQPTLLGHARQFFYKPPILRLALWHNSSKQGASWFRAPAPMLDAGFVVSPTLANTDDALNVYVDAALNRPYACSIELGAGNERFWQQTISYRLYNIENTLGRSAHDRLPQLLSYAGFQCAPTEIVASSNAFVSVESKPAFFLPIGGYMRLNVPKGATMLEGKWGLGSSSANAPAVDFHVEEETPDGTRLILQSHVANPGEYGMVKFTVQLSSNSEHRIILRTAPTLRSDATNTFPLSCWADVRFN